LKHSRVTLALVALAVALALPPRPLAADEAAEADEKVLKDAGVGTDGPALLDFFRRRTLSDVDRKRIGGLIGQLGSNSFEDREQASRSLRARGTPAVPFLRRALGEADLEVARRARLCLEEIENGPGPALAAAAARTLARRQPPGTVPTLLAYLPHADDETVEEAVLGALLATSPEGKPDRGLAAALEDPFPLRREAAAHVLGRKGDTAQRAAVRQLLADKEVRVRFRAAQALLVAGRDRAAVPALINLLADAPPALAWQAEETLHLLAGAQAPDVSAGDRDEAGRRKCRDAWMAWWTEHGAGADLARLTEAGRLLGLTLGIEYNTGRVWECGMDGKLRWEITGLAGPMEAQVLPGGRVLIAEANNNKVSERHVKGKVLWEKHVPGGPTGCQRLPNGNTFVSTYTSVMEFDRAGKQVYSFNLPGSNAIRKQPNGHILYARDGEIVEVDTAGKQVRVVPLPRQTMYVGVQGLPGDRFLVANSSTGQVLEVDQTGKVLREDRVPGACGVSRLPNGHTLVSAKNLVVELDRSGRRVWEQRSAGYVRRVHRR
jgi:hypothetical protein